MIYLLDTNTLIHMMRGLKITSPRNERESSRQQLGRRIFDRARRKETAGHEVAVSSITVAELEFGAQHSGAYKREIEITRRILTPFTLLDFDSAECVRCYGEVRNSLGGIGKSIGPLDTLIAAHALAVEATCVTSNESEFARVSGLKVENWTA